MVKKKDLFQCNDCKLWYPTKKLAESCYDFCKNRGMCSVEITMQSVKPEDA